MNKTVKANLDKVIEYAKRNDSCIERLILFGEAMTDDDECATIRLVVTFIDGSDIEASFRNVLRLIDDLTEGNFELLLTNGTEFTESAKRDIEKGVTVFNRKEQTPQN